MPFAASFPDEVQLWVPMFGWAPALHAVGGDVRSAVHASTNGSTGAPQGRRTLWLLVAGEFALAAMLLVCGTLLVKAFDRIQHVDPGFRADHVLTLSVPLSEAADRSRSSGWPSGINCANGRARCQA
jgi:hypothetical protein